MNFISPRIDTGRITGITIGKMCVTRHPEKCGSHRVAVIYNGSTGYGTLHWSQIAQLIDETPRALIVFDGDLRHFTDRPERNYCWLDEQPLDQALSFIFRIAELPDWSD